MMPFALLLSLPALVAIAPQADEVRATDRIRARCQAVVDGLVQGPLPGASAALILPDGELLALTAGVASLDDGEALAPDHRLLAGSAGKTFVAAAALRLALAGRLDLDAPAASYFEGEPEWLAALPNGREVTLRQLLRHQSGLPRYVFKPEFSDTLASEPDRVWRPEELLGFVSGDRPLFAPGEGWAYSDTSYILVGMVIEAVAQASFYDYVREHFIEPFDLEHTLASDRRRIERMAQGHVSLGRQMGVPARTLEDGAFVYNVQFEWCGGGWASTPSDLARWARVLYDGQALEGAYLEALLDGVPASGLGPGARYGLATILRETPAGPAVGHDGFMPGYLTALAWFPEARIAAALQLNGDDGGVLGRPMVVVLAELVAIASEELAAGD